MIGFAPLKEHLIIIILILVLEDFLIYHDGICFICQSFKITVKTEMGGLPNSPKISQQISIKSTVFEAMKNFYDLYFKRMKTKFPFTSEPEELTFQVSNTDEIVDGDHPLIHFVCVREFLANLVCIQELSKTLFYIDYIVP
jgi:hypothetical protein